MNQSQYKILSQLKDWDHLKIIKLSDYLRKQVILNYLRGKSQYQLKAMKIIMKMESKISLLLIIFKIITIFLTRIQMMMLEYQIFSITKF